jgi:hypothetical protein
MMGDEGRGQGYGPYGERPDYRGQDYGGYRGAPRHTGDGYRAQQRYTRPRPDRLVPDYDYDERGFVSRAGDEVRSWFGDEDAGRRRALDRRYDEYYEGYDPDYYGWRERQIAALDNDYRDYRRERQQHFNQQFDNWRGERDRQRASLGQVKEHMDVVGNDGAHVGTVDKVRGDRIMLTKSDPEADGRHHSVPVRWIQSVDDKVTLNKTADEAHRLWQDEERNMFFGRDAGSAGLDPMTGYGRFGGF